MAEKIILAIYYKSGQKIEISVHDYEEMLLHKKQKEITEFIYQRLSSRYIKPFTFDNSEYKERFKNGFSIMANCCLLIETLESFINGWETTNRKSEKAFKSFLKRENRFKNFKSFESQFYTNVRCGILHQAETTGGWKIVRRGEMFDEKTLTINATRFLSEVEKTLKEYSQKLEKEEWDSELWDNFRRKMRSVIKNCNREK